MKQSDYSLPLKTQARIKAAEILMSICKSQLRNPDSAVVLAFAEFSHDLETKVEDLRQEGKPLNLKGKPGVPQPQPFRG